MPQSNTTSTVKPNTHHHNVTVVVVGHLLYQVLEAVVLDQHHSSLRIPQLLLKLWYGLRALA